MPHVSESGGWTRPGREWSFRLEQGLGPMNIELGGSRESREAFGSASLQHPVRKRRMTGVSTQTLVDPG